MESGLLSRSSSHGGDPLSTVLSLVKPRGYMSGGIDAGGDWAIEFGRDPFVRCFVLVSGHCQLSIGGAAEAVTLAAGDFVVLPHGCPFRLGSDSQATAVDIMSIIDGPLNGRILSWRGGGSCLALSALFTFEGHHTAVLLKALPSLVHIREPADRAAMRWYLEQMMSLLRDAQPGHVLLAEHLTSIMLIEVLRLHVMQTGMQRIGWLAALVDEKLGAAISAVHGAPGGPWTLEELAKRARMSRSAFAARFKARVGVSAVSYLTQWRMLLAAERLSTSSESVLDIAVSLGYESESSFGFAFKREMGCAPRRYSLLGTR